MLGIGGLALLEGEDAAYDQLFDRIYAAVKPVDDVAQRLARDCAWDEPDAVDKVN
jgi:hypothetical protein